jgi:YspA, cpYpsA-related SLOG family
MKLIIAGSRDLWLRHDELFEIVDKFGILYEITEIVSGCASGIDSSAIEFANRYKITLRRFEANWDKYGRLAGPRRNLEMAQHADALLIIWDGRSRGSANMRARMKGMGKPIFEVVKE